MIYPRLLIGKPLWKEVKIDKSFLVDVTRKDLTFLLQDLLMSPPEEVVITDLTLRPGIVRTILLKFVEEFPNELTVYSSTDVIDHVLLSRFRHVKKKLEDNIYSQDKINPSLLALSLVHSRWRHKILGLFDAE